VDQAQDKLFEVLFSKIDDLHSDVRQFQDKFDKHLEEDRKLATEVLFIKRAFQATWGTLAMSLAYLGVKNS
jgi:hypothetical protein